MLNPGGLFILTVPSHNWATRFRDQSNAEIAEFQMVSGDINYVPSITRTPERQMMLARKAGLLPREFRAYQLSDIEGPVSSKLVAKNDTDVLDAFAFSKPR